MFSVIISEKGEAERRETFDRAEINVGRVQGNDLMLAKGNVSKRHARLLYRDGRFIVTDLKSTNGTYVNGRKIAQATIVREGDKIYIGDFVLRIEAGSPAGAPAEDAAVLHADLAVEAGSPPSVEPKPPSSSRGLAEPVKPRPPADSGLGSSGFPNVAGILGSTPPGAAAIPVTLGPDAKLADPKTGDRHEVISHFPLEHDPDESSHFALPGPPRVPSPGRSVVVKSVSIPAPQVSGRSAPTTPVVAHDAFPGKPVAHGGPFDRPTSPSVGLIAGAVPPPRRPLPTAPVDAVMGTFGVRRSPGAEVRRSTPAETPVAIPPPPMHEGTPSKAADRTSDAVRGGALAALVERVGEVVDLGPLASGAPPSDALAGQIERAIAEAADALRGQSDLDLDALVLEARRELFEVGPLTPLFEDEDVSEVQVIRHDHVLAMRANRQVSSDVAFSSEAGVGRAVRRLCASSGKPLAEGETFVERRLARGGRLFAVLPRSEEQGHLLVVRKPQRADLTLDDLVRSGTISRAMAGLFALCVSARANILVTGAMGSGTTTLLGALAAAGSTDDRVVVLQEDDELVFNQPHIISMLLGDTPGDGARAVQAAARVRPDRLVVGAFSGPVAAELVGVTGDGIGGVLAAAHAPTLRQAVARLPVEVAASRPGLPSDAAREWLASVFDLGIEVALLRDGRRRVLRVCELGVEGDRVALRDIFAFTVERTAAGGTIEGSFNPTGVVPGIVEDLAARGVAVDSTIFKRHGRNDSIVRSP